MIAMQYGFDLADDLDMDRIRARARERGPLFAALPGLVEKAFLCRARSSTLPNRYATFYLWRDAAAARAFLAGGLFAAVVEAFGQPTIRSLLVLHHRSVDAGIAAAQASEETIALVGDESILALAAREARASAPAPSGLRARTVALDPLRRELVRFSLWDAAALIPADSRGLDYEVPYLATPASRRDEPRRLAVG